MAKRPRPRTQRRAHERARKKLVSAREELAALSEGGTPQRPIEVPSFAVLEPRARAVPCPLCDGELSIVEQRAQGAGLRAVDVWCQRCNTPRTLWFGVAAPFLN